MIHIPRIILYRFLEDHEAPAEEVALQSRDPGVHPSQVVHEILLKIFQAVPAGYQNLSYL